MLIQEREREDWNEWKEDQDEEIELLYDPDEEDNPMAPTRFKNEKTRPGAGSGSTRGLPRSLIAPAGTPISQLTSFKGSTKSFDGPTSSPTNSRARVPGDTGALRASAPASQVNPKLNYTKLN